MASKTKQQQAAEVFGKIAVDLGKLIFGGIILASIFSSELNRLLIVILGVVCFAILILGGGLLIIKSKEDTV